MSATSSYGWRHLVNAYTKERQAWCILQVKLCDPCLSALEVVTTMRYTIRRIQYTLLLAFLHGLFSL